MARRARQLKLTSMKQLWPTERQEQIALVGWLRIKGIKFYAIPNGAHVGNVIEAVNLKRQGLSNGIPDLCLPLPKKSYHGLYIELKRVQGGIISKEQQGWIDYLNEVGYKAIICYGCDQAIKVIEDYLA